MQAPVSANDDSAAIQKKEKTTEAVYTHGSMQLILGHTLGTWEKSITLKDQNGRNHNHAEEVHVRYSALLEVGGEEKFSRACLSWRTDHPWFSFPMSLRTQKRTS